MQVLTEVFADFAKLEDWPGVGRSIPLGPAEMHPELVQLEGQCVLLTDWNSLRCQGVIVRYFAYGRDQFYGVPTAPLEDIPPEELA